MSHTLRLSAGLGLVLGLLLLLIVLLAYMRAGDLPISPLPTTNPDLAIYGIDSRSDRSGTSIDADGRNETVVWDEKDCACGE